MLFFKLSESLGEWTCSIDIKFKCVLPVIHAKIIYPPPPPPNYRMFLWPNGVVHVTAVGRYKFESRSGPLFFGLDII